MSEELPGRVRRAFDDHGSFERIDDDAYESVTTPFDATVRVAEDEGRLRFAVTVRVPTLSAVVDGDVAEVVEEGWFETFALRIEDIGGITRTNRDLDPTIRSEGEAVVVETAFGDVNKRRGVDDAGAVIDYVEGTYVQGVIPGYEYTGPVSSLISRARETAGDGGPSM